MRETEVWREGEAEREKWRADRIAEAERRQEQWAARAAHSTGSEPAGARLLLSPARLRLRQLDLPPPPAGLDHDVEKGAQRHGVLVVGHEPVAPVGRYDGEVLSRSSARVGPLTH
jgi:hypothetical protein